MKRAMRAGEIVLLSKPATANSEDSLRELVKKVMNIVAFEPPADRIRRLLHLNLESVTYERENTETLREFFHRFKFAAHSFSILLVQNRGESNARMSHFAYF